MSLPLAYGGGALPVARGGNRRYWIYRRWRRLCRAVAAAGWLASVASLCPGGISAQDASWGSNAGSRAAPLPAQPLAQRTVQYPPGSLGIPPDLGGDRPRRTPDPLRPDAVAPNSGVEVGVGGPLVSIDSRRLNFSQGPQRFMSDGALLSADIVLDRWRLEYAKLLLRRPLEAGTAYHNNPVNFVGVDADQFWAFYGWWPLYNLYLGGGLGYEYRLTRLSNSGSSVKAFTDTLTIRGVIADWAVSPPVTLRFRVYDEDGGGIVHISGTAVQIGYIVPF
jgi:hypothetical protein